MKLVKFSYFYQIRRTMSLLHTEKNFTVNAPWGKISGISWGDSSHPPVLMSPGRLVPCTSYRPLLKLLPDRFFYVAIDLPGNGWSDNLPPGIRFTSFDLVPTVECVVRHFGWKKIVFVGHSLGSVVGTYFHLAYPDVISRLVYLDPMPLLIKVSPSFFPAWYKQYYRDYYDEDKYKKWIAGTETAPKYTLEKIKKKLMEAHHCNEETLAHIIDRYIEPAGDGLYRFTYDQRMKNTTIIPFSADNLKYLLTSIKIPILSVFSEHLLKTNFYKKIQFVFDKEAWPNKNYNFKIVAGDHDAYMTNPQSMSDDIATFLQEDRRAKL